MLLNIHELFAKYKMKVTGVIEIGAHFGQEYDAYSLLGVEHFIFIEPCTAAFNELYRRLYNKPGVDRLLKYACGDISGKAVMFTGPTNQGMSNSLLKPKVHLTQHPDVIFSDTEMVDVERLDNLEFDRSQYNLINMDAQGFEGRILMGAAETLKNIDYIYTEVNRLEMYENNAMVDQLDAMLPEFKRVETGWASDYHGWGDALFIRKTLL
jgi:FkbM family methyltransferase